ncbi:PAS domain-containing sensor histidine kinase [Woodsholea maritima]|uniref:PAS domain-containing sensor histidine kinase n=1 Tax=Woodsholea maritima TaxID=240237 RepID=UPI00036C94A6|nr:PAS domain S-box protein [Woodsholea maritima]
MKPEGTTDPNEHYLKTEFYETFTRDFEVIEFLKAGCLDGVWYWDLENPDQEWMSPKFWSTLGYDYRDKAHSPEAWQGLIHPDDLKVALDNFHQHCADPNYPYDQIVRYRHSNGSTVWVRCRGIAIRKPDGTPVRLLGVHTDVTALKEAEIELQTKNDELAATARTLAQREGDLQLIIDNMPTMIWYKDEHNTILRANKAVADSLGLTTQDLENADTYALHPEMAKTYHDDDLAVLSAGKARHGMVEVYEGEDGQRHWVSTDKIPLTTTRGERTLLVIARDVSDLKQREERLDKSLRDFTFAASHDLQEPLRRAMLLADTIRKDLNETGSVTSQVALNQLLSGLSHMRVLVKNLFVLASLNTETLNKTSVDLNHVLDEALTRHKDLLADNKAEIDRPNLPTISGERDLLVQVFSNLISNACLYRSSAPLKIALEVELCPETHDVSIIFSDNGAGIAPELQEKVFEPFRRLHHAHEREGIGLGLAIARQIVHLHEGEIKLDPNYRDGSRFLITLRG